MSRRRMIDPDFWSDGRVKHLTPIERLFFLGLISHADDEGRIQANPAFLRSIIFPYDDFTLEQITEMRTHVVESNPNLQLYQNSGEEYLCFKKWSRYQKPSHPQPSKLPKPPEKPELQESVQEVKQESVQESVQSQTGIIPSQVRLGKVSIGEPTVPATAVASADKPKKEKPHQKEAGAFLSLVEKHEAVPLLNRGKLIHLVRTKLFKDLRSTPEKLLEFYLWLKKNDKFFEGKAPPQVIGAMPDRYPSWLDGKLKPSQGRARDGPIQVARPAPTTEELKKSWKGK